MKLFILLCMVSTVAFIYDVPTGISVFKYGLYLFVTFVVFKFLYLLLKPNKKVYRTIDSTDLEDNYTDTSNPWIFNAAGQYDPALHLRSGEFSIVTVDED